MNKKILCIGFIVIAVIISLSAVSGGLFDRDNGEVQDVFIKKLSGGYTTPLPDKNGNKPLPSTPVTIEFVPYINIDNYKNIKLVNGETKYKNGTTDKCKNDDWKLTVDWKKSGTDPNGILFKDNLYLLEYKQSYKNRKDIDNIDSISGDIIAETTTGDIFLTHLDEKFW